MTQPIQIVLPVKGSPALRVADNLLITNKIANLTPLKTEGVTCIYLSDYQRFRCIAAKKERLPCFIFPPLLTDVRQQRIDAQGRRGGRQCRTCPPPGTGRGTGPAGDKFSRSEDAGNGGRVRSEA